jgi:hypothetical protein
MMRSLAAILMVLAAPAAFGYTAAELAAKNIEARGRGGQARRQPSKRMAPATAVAWSRNGLTRTRSDGSCCRRT